LIGTIHHLEDGEVPQYIMAVGERWGEELGTSRLAELVEGRWPPPPIFGEREESAEEAKQALAEQLQRMLGPTAGIQTGGVGWRDAGKVIKLGAPKVPK
jgi:hypothetical protein